MSSNQRVDCTVNDLNQTWFPNLPPQTIVESVDIDTLEKLNKLSIPTSTALPPPCSVWETGTLKYTTSNKWQSISNEKREACRRHRIHGVEIRKLGLDHVLCGEYGLFATQKFSIFDVIGEYTGKIVDSDVSGHYVAALEDKGNDDSLGIDAQIHGSELRFINSYLNIGFKANCTMRTVYVNTYPHIVIVCTENIEIGDEFLLDYGEAYTKMFLTPKLKNSNIPIDIIQSALPGYGSDKSNDSENDENEGECGDRIGTIG